jgi:hypothetical protein
MKVDSVGEYLGVFDRHGAGSWCGLLKLAATHACADVRRTP